MKIIKGIAISIAALLVTASLALVVTGNSHLFKAIANTYLVGRTGPSIDEYNIFTYREVETEDAQNLTYSDQFGHIKEDPELLSEIERYDPAALLIMLKGKVVYEKYWGDYSATSYTNSFSVAKSIVGLATGICIDLGLVQGVDQKVIDIIPELKGPYRESVTIRHLLTMTSGIDFDESYGDPFGFMAKAYYGDELEKKTLAYEAIQEPGTEWKYLGGNTILLSLIVERTSKQSLSDFVSTHLWKKIGANLPALWNLDDEGGIEKAYCCFYSNAQDFAKIGQLVLNNGLLEGQQIINPDFIVEMSHAVTLNDGNPVEHYGWHWWRCQHHNATAVYARGILGQYIIVMPDIEAVIVRLGHRRGENDEHKQPVDLYDYLDLAYFMAGQTQ